VTTKKSSKSVGAGLESLGLFGAVAKRGGVEAGGVHLIRAVLMVVNDVLVGVGTQDEVKAVHVKASRVAVVTVNEELVNVGEIELGISPLPDH
jgi:hypothetical protein